MVMERKEAYYSVLKFKLSQLMLEEGFKRQQAYPMAQRFAAQYVFQSSTEDLNIWLAC